MGSIIRFTLVELMVVVAILAVLASLGIAIAADAQIRARSAEAFALVDGLGETTFLYATELGTDHGRSQLIGTFVRPTSHLDMKPVSTQDALDRTLHPWPTNTGDWALLGWQPDGSVRCGYYFAAGGPLSPVGFAHTRPSSDGGSMAGSMCDVDDDNVILILEGVRTPTGPIDLYSACRDANTGRPTCHCDGVEVNTEYTRGSPC